MDTVIIKIYGPGKFQIERRFLFVPELTVRGYGELSMTERESNALYLRHFVLHPHRYDGYMPGVEVFETIAEDRQSLIYILQLTFSIPKLLYQNSLQEVVESDREYVFSRLKTALSGVGIILDNHQIAEARVTGAHFCKNIILPKTMRMRDILRELERTDINKTVDVTSKEFKNGGRVLGIYSGTTERVFYDKISDAMRPKNKRKDKEHIDYEREIVERYGLKGYEVFRYEYRIKKTQTVMRDVSRGLERSYGPIAFKDLFTPGLFKKMVLDSWRALIERPENRLALFDPADNLKLLLHITGEAKKLGASQHTLNKALTSYGLVRAIGDHGVKEVRGILLGSWCKEHPERLTQKIQTAVDLTQHILYSNNIGFIDKALEEFTPVDLASLQRAT